MESLGMCFTVYLRKVPSAFLYSVLLIFINSTQIILLGVPKKVKRLIDHRTKGFCSVIKFSFDLSRKHLNLDFGTKIAQIRYQLTGIHKF